MLDTTISAVSRAGRPFIRAFLPLAASLLAGATLLTAQANTARATSPLLQWNFNNDVGSTVTNTGTLAPGGNLTTIAPVSLGDAGSGVTGAPGDIALDATSNNYNDNTSGVAASSTGNITTASLTKFTITGWLQDTGFSNSGNGFTGGQPRILTIGPAGYDGGLGTAGSLQLRVYNTLSVSNQLQLKINGAGGADNFNGLVSTTTGGILPDTSAWTFLAVTYDSTTPNATNNVSMYIGDNVPEHTLSTAAFTGKYQLDSAHPNASPGALQFTGALAYLMNISTLSKGYTGLADDFRLYGDVISPTNLDRIRLGLALLTPGDWDFSGSVTPADLPVMLAALTDLGQFQSSHNLAPADVTTLGDLNHDGQVTNLDIQAEIGLILASGGGSITAVPEPSTALLLAGFLAGLGFCKFSVRYHEPRDSSPGFRPGKPAVFSPQNLFCLFSNNKNKVLASVVGPH